jgi:hypothetical protein
MERRPKTRREAWLRRSMVLVGRPAGIDNASMYAIEGWKETYGDDNGTV